MSDQSLHTLRVEINNIMISFLAKEGRPTMDEAIHQTKLDLLTLLNNKIHEAQLEAVKELKRRWDEDRKTMDYSPATYQFICDKYIKELESLLNETKQ